MRMERENKRGFKRENVLSGICGGLTFYVTEK